MGDLIADLKDCKRACVETFDFAVDSHIIQTMERVIDALQQPRLPDGLEDVLRFLNGEIDLHGYWFGGELKPADALGNFWWRRYIRPFLPSTKPEAEKKETLEDAFSREFHREGLDSWADQAQKVGSTPHAVKWLLRKLDERP